LSAIFEETVSLRVGEALLFSPSSIVDVVMGNGDGKEPKKLGIAYLKIRFELESRTTEAKVSWHNEDTIFIRLDDI